MNSHAPAQIEDEVADEVEVIRAAGKRSSAKKIDLSDPRQINKEVVLALARRVSPDVIAAKIESLMNMTRPTKYGPAADVRAMESGIKLYLAYVIGLPTQRQEVISVTLDADSMVGLRERLKASPAMRQTLAGLLEEVEGDAEAREMPVEQSPDHNM